MNQISIGNKLASNNLDDAPELTEADFARARYQIAGNYVSRAEWQHAIRSEIASCNVTLNMDAKIYEVRANFIEGELNAH